MTWLRIKFRNFRGGLFRCRQWVLWQLIRLATAIRQWLINRYNAPLPGESVLYGRSIRRTWRYTREDEPRSDSR